MNIDFYRSFLTVVQCKSFTKAAGILNLSQSTVSNRIKELEKYYGQNLFNRFNNGIEISSYGKELIDYAEDIVSLNDDALSHIKSKTDLKETIHLGSVSAFYQPHLKAYIKKHLKTENSLLQVDLRHSKEIIQGVVSGKYDLGISHHPSYFKMYNCELIFKDDLILVGSKKYKNYQKGISYEQLKKIPIYHTRLFDEHIESDLFSALNYRFSIDLSDKAIDLVIENDTCTFLPRKMVEVYILKGDLYEIPLMDYDLPPLLYYLISKKGLSDSKLIKLMPKL